MPLDAVEWRFPTLDGNPFLTAAGGALDRHVVGPAAVAAEVDSFEPEAVRAADNGAHIEGAAQVMYEYGERERCFVCDFAVPRFLLQVNIAFKAEPGPSAERLVQVDHLGLIFPGKALAFGELHPFGVSLEFAFGAGHVVAQLQNDDTQKFGHALGLGSLFCR